MRDLNLATPRYILQPDQYKTVSFQAQEFLNQPIDNSIGYQSKYKGPMATRR
jgi:hypothetical protein